MNQQDPTLLAPSWSHKNISGSQRLSHTHLRQLLDGDIVGSIIDGVLSNEACASATQSMLKRSKQGGYAGNLQSLLEASSHYSLRYEHHDSDSEWQEYFRCVDEWHETRKQIFEEALGEDPLDIFLSILKAAWDGPVEPARHPVYGRPLYSGLVRSGAPLLHFDYAPYDLGSNFIGQFGMVLTLNAMKDAFQRVYRVLGCTPGNVAPSKTIGNYDLPTSLVENAEFDDIPTPVGSVGFLSNRFLHEVYDFERRVTFSIHVASTKDGRLVYFS